MNLSVLITQESWAQNENYCFESIPVCANKTTEAMVGLTSLVGNCKSREVRIRGIDVFPSAWCRSSSPYAVDWSVPCSLWSSRKPPSRLLRWVSLDSSNRHDKGRSCGLETSTLGGSGGAGSCFASFSENIAAQVLISLIRSCNVSRTCFSK